MKIGTKSLLYGYHQFIFHPLALAFAWWLLYGFPFDPRLWIAFFVHDLGYFGKPNMDGPEGETHPKLGASIMRIFGKSWCEFTLLHSRFYAAQLKKEPSRLCVADKYVIVILPARVQLFLMWLSGELKECVLGQQGRTPKHRNQSNLEWVKSMQAVCKDFVEVELTKEQHKQYEKIVEQLKQGSNRRSN